MKRRIFSTLCTSLFIVLFCLSSDPAMAREKKGRKAGKKTEVADTVRKQTPYDKLFRKEHRTEKGMITLHHLDGEVYFEMPLSILGREMVMGSTIKSISNNANGVVGSKPMTLKHIVFTRVDSTVIMSGVGTDYMSGDSNISSAIAKGMGNTSLKAMPIKAWSNDSSAVVFNVTDIFLEHDESMSPFSNYAAYSSYERNENFKKDLSYIVGIKAFADNVSVTSSMSYTYNMSDGSGRSLLKNEPLTAELTRSLLLLPEKPYHPRMGDYRIGVFTTERMQYGDGTKTSRPVRFANRWRLEPSDTAAYLRGELVEPAKPIVFYIDSDFPEWWKPYIKEAVEQWNEPFEAIGFRNAVRAMYFPQDDPAFDPDNIRYSCIRYAPIGVQNAMGPSWTDPRSGEIINASVYVYHDVVRLIRRWMYVQTAQANPDIRGGDIPEETLGDALRYVVSHEVGHCLGFMHNMSASSVIPVESLRDPKFTSRTGTTTSIMDYARFNYVARPGDRERGVKLTPPRFGAYDRWLVRWTYTPVFGADDLEAEGRVTSGWITDSLAAAPFYRYGKQQFYSMFFDPRAQAEDLGDDSVEASKYGVENLKYISSNFMDWVEDDPDFSFRMEIYNGLVNQYLTYAQHCLMNVGGLYKNDVKSSDLMPPFENIPAAKQKKALDYVYSLSKDLSWLSDKNIFDRLPLAGSAEDAVRDAIYDMILLTPFMVHLTDALSTREFSAWDCLDKIYDYVWSCCRSGKKLTRAQKSFQVKFVNTFMAAGGFASPSSGKDHGLTEDVFHIADSGCGCCSDTGNFAGDMTYSPVCGYEWVPRAIFNHGTLTAADMYALLTKASDLMKSCRASADAADRAHYDILIQTIAHSIKK